MSKHGIFATLLHHPANTVLLKNLLRWRADDIRPYTVCATELLLKNLQRWRADDIRPYMEYATELPAQKFRCTYEVLKF